jgi:hypothetical protein
VTPEVEASLCVENSRHKFVDILEEKRVNVFFCDDDNDEFIPVAEIPSLIEHIRSTPDNALFHIDSSLCSAIIEAAETKQELSQDEANVLLNMVLSSNGGRRCTLVPTLKTAKKRKFGPK